MATESVQEFVRSIRASLRERGPLGTFLLSQLEAAISRGIDEQNVSTLERVGWRAEDDVGSRTADDDELIAIVVNTFVTYLATFPAVADEIADYLREHYRVRQVEISLDPSLLGEAQGVDGRIPLESAIPRLQSDAAIQALGTLQTLLPRLNGGEM